MNVTSFASLEIVVTRSLYRVARDREDLAQVALMRPSSHALAAVMRDLIATRDGATYYFVRTGRDKCAGARIPTADLDKAVVEHLADQLFTEERCQLLLKDILQETGMLRRKVNEQLRLMQAELEGVEKKLRVWEEAFESGALPADLGLERVTELRGRRDELRQTLTKVMPIQPPPPHIFAPANVQRFRQHIRGIFVGGDNALTKHYLRHLVARIEVTDAHVRVLGKIEAVAQLLAEKTAAPSTVLTAGGEVLTSVGTWLRRRVSNDSISSTIAGTSSIY